MELKPTLPEGHVSRQFTPQYLWYQLVALTPQTDANAYYWMKWMKQMPRALRDQLGVRAPKDTVNRASMVNSSGPPPVFKDGVKSSVPPEVLTLPSSALRANAPLVPFAISEEVVETTGSSDTVRSLPSSDIPPGAQQNVLPVRADAQASTARGEHSVVPSNESTNALILQALTELTTVMRSVKTGVDEVVSLRQSPMERAMYKLADTMEVEDSGTLDNLIQETEALAKPQISGEVDP